jgi:hypothetical protein
MYIVFDIFTHAHTKVVLCVYIANIDMNLRIIVILYNLIYFLGYLKNDHYKMIVDGLSQIL